MAAEPISFPVLLFVINLLFYVFGLLTFTTLFLFSLRILDMQ